VAAGVPLEHITMTSDGCGSLPDFDEDGNLVKLETGQPSSVLREILATMREEGMPLEQALRVATANVADILKLPRKGRIAVGYDADLVVLDGDDQIRHLVANGTLMVHDGDMLVKGTFER
jgi:beta-aspartyl-dipeptidase (metallo-type)